MQEAGIVQTSGIKVDSWEAGAVIVKHSGYYLLGTGHTSAIGKGPSILLRKQDKGHYYHAQVKPAATTTLVASRRCFTWDVGHILPIIILLRLY